MAEKTDQELLDMLTKPDDWRPEALEAAGAELQKRHVDPVERFSQASVTPHPPETKVPQTWSDIAFLYRGRISRSTFWCALLFLLGANLIFIFTVVAWSSLLPGRVGDGLFSLGMILWFPLQVWISLPVQVKRWHDLGVTGWAVLINVVPIINILGILLPYEALIQGWNTARH